MSSQLSAHFLRTIPSTMRAFKNLLHEQSSDNLSVPQLRVLRFTHYGYDQVSLIAKSLSVSQASISKLVDGLVEKGLIKKVCRCETDKRTTKLELTSKGVLAHQEIERELAKQLDVKFKNLTKKDKTELKRGLDILEKVFTSESLL